MLAAAEHAAQTEATQDARAFLSAMNQALSVEYLVENHATLEHKVFPVPFELDKKVARLKLESMGVKIDRLSPEQEEYLASWSEGT